MTPSISDIRRSLSDCRAHLDRLADIRPVDGPDCGSGVRAVRNTMFAEFAVWWGGERWMLSTPLTALAEEAVERMSCMAARLRGVGSEYLAELRVFHSELRFTDSAGGEHTCDVVMQRLPDGMSMDRIESVVSHSRLRAELTNMQAELRRIGFAHNNLKASNIVLVNEEHPVAVRFHFARMCGAAASAAEFAADDRAFAALHEYVASKPQADSFVPHRPAVQMTTEEGCLIVGAEHERRVRILRDGYIGFADPSGATVIEPQFDRAEDFREGRAEAVVNGHTGLIDKSGRWVIPARYDVLEYHDGCGISLALSDGVWSAFDYEGYPTGICHWNVGTLADILQQRMNVTIEV